MNYRLGILGFAVLALIVALPSAQAVVVAPGGACVPPTCTAFAPGDLGAELATTGNVAIASPTAGAWTGTMRAKVYADNTPGGGPTDGLIFIYQFVHTGGTEAINRITHFSFGDGTIITDLGFIAGDPDGGGIFTAGTQAYTEGDRSISGATVGFDFEGAGGIITAGETSFTMVIKTNALAFGQGLTGVINGGTANVFTFSPVPEPSFYGLLAVGMGGLIVLARRRKRSV